MYAVVSTVYTTVATDSWLSTINNNITLQANQSTTYTKLESCGKAETFTTTEIMWLNQTQYTVAAPLIMGINLRTGKFAILMAPAYDDSVDAK